MNRVFHNRLKMAVTARAGGACTQFKPKHQSKHQRVLPANMALHKTAGYKRFLINVYLAFIHIGRYDIKARRHLACVQNGITQLGDWRMETWQLALRAYCHVSICQSPSLCNAILNTCPCLLAIIFNLFHIYLGRLKCPKWRLSLNECNLIQFNSCLCVLARVRRYMMWLSGL